MKTLMWVALPLGTLFALHAQAATTRGVIHFTGRIYAPASASVVFGDTRGANTARNLRVFPLANAQKILPAEALEYFASYAPKDAKLVSATYN